MSTAEERPRLLVVAGPNGSGKTTVTERGLAHEWFSGCEYINPDLIARDECGDWNSPDAVLRAAGLAQTRRETCLADRRSLAMESVFSAPGVPAGSCMDGADRSGAKRKNIASCLVSLRCVWWPKNGY